MKILVTGADGFLGWHLRCRALSRGVDTVPVRRHDFADVSRLASLLADVDAVVHVAGVNRGPEGDVRSGNPWLAQRLVDALDRAGTTPPVVYANSVQAKGDSTYGQSKREAAELIAGWSRRAGAKLHDILLPNLFGEHGRPHYNSFVATFAHEIATGGTPEVTDDRELPLLHVGDAADGLLSRATGDLADAEEFPATPVTISQVRHLLSEFLLTYRTGEVPELTTPFRVQLFNTLRSHLFPTAYPIGVEPRADQRGVLVECVRSRTPRGQTFVSSTVPGATRGEHFHLRKFERFLVVDGTAEIALRRLFTREVIRFPVTGERPAIVDMPTLWVHSIRNTGDSPVTTLFWTNELFDPVDPDTFARPTEGTEELVGRQRAEHAA